MTPEEWHKMLIKMSEQPVSCRICGRRLYIFHPEEETIEILNNYVQVCNDDNFNWCDFCDDCFNGIMTVAKAVINNGVKEFKKEQLTK